MRCSARNGSSSRPIECFLVHKAKNFSTLRVCAALLLLLLMYMWVGEEIAECCVCMQAGGIAGGVQLRVCVGGGVGQKGKQ